MVELETGPDKEKKDPAGRLVTSDVPNALVRLWALRTLDELDVCPMRARPPARVRLCRLISGGEPMPCAGDIDLCDRSACPVRTLRAAAEASGPAWAGKLGACVDRFGEQLGLDTVERGILAIVALSESDRRMKDLFSALGPVRLRHRNILLAAMMGCTRDQVARALAEGGTLSGLIEKVAPVKGRPRTVIDLDRLEAEREMPDTEDPDAPGDDDDGYPF